MSNFVKNHLDKLKILLIKIYYLWSKQSIIYFHNMITIKRISYHLKRSSFITPKHVQAHIASIKKPYRHLNNQMSINLFNSIHYRYSSFKDQFNEPGQQVTGALKEFQQQINHFQNSYDKQNYQQAYQHLQKAAEIMRKVNCQNSIQYIQIMLNMVVTCKKINSGEKVVSALLNAQDILENLSEQNYSYKQIVYSNLSSEYDRLKNINKTIEYLNKLLIIYNKTNIESFEVVAINQKIGSLYLDQSNQNESISYFVKALELINKLSGQNSKDSQKILDDLSYVYYKLGKLQDALQNRLKILAIQEKHSGKENLAYISHLKNVGVIYKRLKNHEKYFEYFQQALALSSKIGQLQNPTVIMIRQNLAVSYFSVEQFQKALPLLQAAIGTISSELQSDKYLYFLKAIAECYKNTHEYTLSMAKYKEILDVLSKKDERSCQFAYILSQIGLMNYNLQKYQDSLNLYLKSLEIEENIHGKQSQTCIRIYENIAELYYLLGNNANSQEYLNKIEMYKGNPTKSHY